RINRDYFLNYAFRAEEFVEVHLEHFTYLDGGRARQTIGTAFVLLDLLETHSRAETCGQVALTHVHRGPSQLDALPYELVVVRYGPWIEPLLRWHLYPLKEAI